MGATGLEVQRIRVKHELAYGRQYERPSEGVSGITECMSFVGLVLQFLSGSNVGMRGFACDVQSLGCTAA